MGLPGPQGLGSTAALALRRRPAGRGRWRRAGRAESRAPSRRSPVAMWPRLTQGPRGALLVLLTGLGPPAAAEKHPVLFGEAAGRPQPLLQTLQRPPGPTRARLLGRLPRPGGAAMARRARERQEQQRQQEPQHAPHGPAGSVARRPAAPGFARLQVPGRPGSLLPPPGSAEDWRCHGNRSPTSPRGGGAVRNRNPGCARGARGQRSAAHRV